MFNWSSETVMFNWSSEAVMCNWSSEAVVTMTSNKDWSSDTVVAMMSSEYNLSSDTVMTSVVAMMTCDDSSGLDNSSELVDSSQLSVSNVSLDVFFNADEVLSHVGVSSSVQNIQNTVLQSFTSETLSSTQSSCVSLLVVAEVSLLDGSWNEVNLLSELEETAGSVLQPVVVLGISTVSLDWNVSWQVDNYVGELTIVQHINMGSVGGESREGLTGLLNVTSFWEFHLLSISQVNSLSIDLTLVANRVLDDITSIDHNSNTSGTSPCGSESSKSLVNSEDMVRGFSHDEVSYVLPFDALSVKHGSMRINV
jgi:hypothetical protein